MSIALYDADFVKWGEKVPYSYTLMKYAAYYKKHHEIVKLITDLNRADKYSKLIYNQDTTDELDRRALSHKDVIFSGLRFDGGVQKPLPPEVEKCAADASIYPLLPKKTQMAAHSIGVLQNSINLMAYTSELPLGSKKQRTVFFHDYNIFSTPNWKERIYETTHVEGKIRPYSFAPHYPQYLPNGEALIFLGTTPIQTLFSTFWMPILTPTPAEAQEFFQTTNNTLHSLLTFSVNNQEIYTDSELAQELIQVFSMNYFAIKHNKDFVLYNKSICKDAFVDYFFDEVVYWSNHHVFKGRRGKIYRDISTFYNYIYKSQKDILGNLERRSIQELFQRQPILKDYSRIDIRDFINRGGVWPV